MKYSYGQFSDEHLGLMTEALTLYNQQKYWECHEALEDLWMEDRGDNARYIYWAIIQVAASCIHYREKNLIGAHGMLSKAKEKFRRARELNVLTELVFKYLNWAEFEELAMRVPDQNSTLEDFTPIYNFRFSNYPAE